MGTTPDISPSDDSGMQRVEGDDDLDLLTYNEARARLAEEASAEEEHLIVLRAQSDEDSARKPSAIEIAASEHRLQALRDALSRTAARAVTDVNSATFYGSDL
jgi:hypothetical protein